jgi:hypothetical protein
MPLEAHCPNLAPEPLLNTIQAVALFLSALLDTLGAGVQRSLGTLSLGGHLGLGLCVCEG